MKRDLLSVPLALFAAAAYTSFRYVLRSLGVGYAPLDLMLLSPMLEEWIYRGLLYRSLRKQYPAIVSGLLSALLFALGHRSLSVAALAVSFGLAAAFLVEKTGKLYFSIILHIIWNLIIFLTRQGGIIHVSLH